MARNKIAPEGPGQFGGMLASPVGRSAIQCRVRGLTSLSNPFMMTRLDADVPAVRSRMRAPVLGQGAQQTLHRHAACGFAADNSRHPLVRVARFVARGERAGAGLSGQAPFDKPVVAMKAVAKTCERITPVSGK